MNSQLERHGISRRSLEIADKVEGFVRTQVVPFEGDPRCGAHGPSDDLGNELKALARSAGVMTPHILEDGDHLTQRETAAVLIRSGLSPLGPLACHTWIPGLSTGQQRSPCSMAAQPLMTKMPLLKPPMLNLSVMKK